eukprot:354535-Chlamydomonas_euryale.AAC.4
MIYGLETRSYRQPRISSSICKGSNQCHLIERHAPHSGDTMGEAVAGMGDGAGGAGACGAGAGGSGATPHHASHTPPRQPHHTTSATLHHASHTPAARALSLSAALPLPDRSPAVLPRSLCGSSRLPEPQTLDPNGHAAAQPLRFLTRSAVLCL